MASLALGVAGAAIGGPVAGPVLGAVGAALGAYIDQTWTYPLLFGKKNPKPDSLEGLQVSTTDPGAARWEVYGTLAWVPCHYLWSLNFRDEVSSAGPGSKGGGGRPFVQTVRADVGIATCDGPISRIETLYSDERPFWTRQVNRVVLQDSRWSIAAGAGAYAGMLTIDATDYDVADFTGAFRARDPGIQHDGDLVRLEGVTPTALSGTTPYYRVIAVAPHTATAKSFIVLLPLQGQTPTAGVAGSEFQPAALRRIDQGCISNAWTFGPSNFRMVRPAGEPSIPGQPVHDKEELKKIWVVGAVYFIKGFTGTARPDGLYRLLSRQGVAAPSDVVYELHWEPVPNDGTGPTGWTAAGTPTNPAIIVRDEPGGDFGTNSRGFLFNDAAQEWVQYVGSNDQPQDPTLAAIKPDPPAHRGIAHLSLKDWNLGPHYNQIPRVTALVQPRIGETVAQAIRRICGRTAPLEHIDVSKVRRKALLGYSVPGGMAGGQALQPLQIMHGVVSQERGGVLTFLDERDLPIVPVATRHLNARPTGDRTTTSGFVAQRPDEVDHVERLVLEYISPEEGENEAEGDGVRAPGSRDRGGRDTIKVNLRPMVVRPFEAKRRSRELRRRSAIEAVGGAVMLPPGYMDVLPSTCLTFVANNRQEESLPAATTIAATLSLRDITPKSVRLQVLFVNGQRATLYDNGAGAFEGLPAGITASANSIDYGTGAVALTCSIDLDTSYAPLVAYLYPKQWLLRARKAKLLGYDFRVACEVVQTTTDNPLPPVPRDLPGIGGPIVSDAQNYRVDLLDIPPLYPGQLRSVLIGLVAAAQPGGTWRGAVVYQSPNGVDRWIPIGQIQEPTVMGTLVDNNLPTTVGGANLGIVDWSTELEIDLPGGELLDGATTEQIAQGANWLLVGDEIIGFHEAEAGDGSSWILRGLVRAMRYTHLAVDTHADGERVVLLTNLGLHGGLYEPVGGPSAANRTYHFRIVPGGMSIDEVPTTTRLIRGRSALPPAPYVEQSLLTQKVGSYVQLEWKRRSMDVTTIFGPSPLQGGEDERYEVVAFAILAAAVLIAGGMSVDNAVAATATQRWQVGGQTMGTPHVDKVVQYEETDFVSHGYTLGAIPIGFVVYQVTAAGKSDRSDVVFITPV